MKFLSFIFLFSNIIFVVPLYDNEISLKCKGRIYKNVTLTAYYPDYNNLDHERGYEDKNGNKLCTLQDFIDNRAEFVTLAMDDKLGIPYGSKACIPELNNHYGHRILLEVRDTSYDLYESGYNRADICVRTEIDSYDVQVNSLVTLVLI